MAEKQNQQSSALVACMPEIYIESAPNNSNETYTFMCWGRVGRFGDA